MERGFSFRFCGPAFCRGFDINVRHVEGRPPVLIHRRHVRPEFDKSRDDEAIGAAVPVLLKAKRHDFVQNRLPPPVARQNVGSPPDKERDHVGTSTEAYVFACEEKVIQ